MDLTKLDYGELTSLARQVESAIQAREPNESKKSKTKWIASDAAKPFRDRIEALKTEYAQLGQRLNIEKDIILQIQLTVDIAPNNFKEVLDHCYELDFNDVFEVVCKGKLLNRAECKGIANEIQDQIDGILDEICGDIAQIHGKLYDSCEDFIVKLNELVNDLNDAQNLGIFASDLLPNKKKGKK